MLPRAISTALNSESLSLVQTLLRLPSGSGRLGIIQGYQNERVTYTRMSRVDCNESDGYAVGMGFPVGPWLPVLMVSLQPLSQSSWAGQLPPVASGEVFWASSRDAPGLVADGQAIYAPPGTVAPPVEPQWTAHGTPGFGAGTSNCTH